MSTPTRPPRKSKRQKREQADATTVKSEGTLPDQPSDQFPVWKVKAKEALDYRNSSLEKIVPPLPEIDIESRSQYTPTSPLDDTTDKPLTKLTPEEIIHSIVKGDMDSSTITNALLRRAGIAAKLVSTQFARYVHPLSSTPDKLHHRTSPIACP